MKDIIEKAIEMAREMVFDGAFVGGYKFKEAEILQALTPPDKDVEADGWIVLYPDGKQFDRKIYNTKEDGIRAKCPSTLQGHDCCFGHRGWQIRPVKLVFTDKPKSEGVG
jgi:hypothetical protein